MITALVGAQFGSEGKGAVAAHLHRKTHHSLSVRVGAANAGHTLYDERGEKHVMQQLPCAAYADPDTILAIGPGALITPHILDREIELLSDWREQRGLPPVNLLIDHRAHVITDEQVQAEQDTDLAARIGSTSTIAREGIGTAQADRVLRKAECVTVRQLTEQGHDALWLECAQIADVPRVIDIIHDSKGWVMLEGTQGTGLSITTGFFPFCTSRNTTAAGLAADCGAAPNRLSRIIVVARCHPIRVAGNSGPFYEDSDEITWEDLGIPTEQERTTVTKKVRRVATLSVKQIEDAVRINGATDIALMFADYVEPSLYGASGDARDYDLDGVGPIIGQIEDACRARARVTLVGTGPDSILER